MMLGVTGAALNKVIELRTKHKAEIFCAPVRDGSGQARKRRESALLAGKILGATCLGARERLLPS